VQPIGKTLELRDSHGGLWADADLVPDPEWISAATSQHYVTVLYGPKLGVRVPPGLPAARYGDAERKAELTDARASGMVAAALVEWRG
jgi:hypothetical protein